ncbi:MAG TPA: porphobilinogen synthase [Smithellaceae bacterium]|jgi:porphobilinogen synthase|nr:porphobilinogen synthase [Syntrophaceae bacterium]NMC90828.1 porphobilinogen synthase [Smithella sp.]OQC74163.1 MAG: Delta-aminolevulinic acid dehydratase [Deltaproteobacteria bacterium ADurb.Bin002]HNV56708.1 porphobilinogen synthase [Smithellaceae bacterium]MBP8665300.1 porphobilinogen synthase [Syntrophaceae bacterium]
MQFPEYRGRRLRKNENFRRLVRETRLSADELVYPLFAVPGRDVKKPIASMPGQFQMSVDHLAKEAREAHALGIPALLLFGIPARKDEQGTGAFAKDGIVQQAVKRVKNEVPDMLVITDVCLCEYTSHGHCGIIEKGEVLNDATLEVLAETALSQVKAGADMVAPSAMMDGQIAAIREILDENALENIPIMAYSAKYASSFYGPFREAAESAPQFGDRKAYQMDPANSDEAIREISLDVNEGADIIMVKPALPYLDIICRARQEFDLPLAAYNVSGEYSMIKAAAKLGWLDEEKAMLESVTAIKRAGADILITYWAKDLAKVLAT